MSHEIALQKWCFIVAILHIYAPGFHQLLHSFLPQLGQHAHHDQIQDLVRQVLVQVRIAPYVQFRLYFLD